MTDCGLMSSANYFINIKYERTCSTYINEDNMRQQGQHLFQIVSSSKIYLVTCNILILIVERGRGSIGQQWPHLKI